MHRAQNHFSITCCSSIIKERVMIIEKLNTVQKLQVALIAAEAFISVFPKDAPYQKIESRFKDLRFEKGWRDTAERVKETMHTLSELRQAPDPEKRDSFISRLPVIFIVVIFFLRGYFGQADVLGMPDTGDQVVYILDQVRALEEELLPRIKPQGLAIKPNILVVAS